MRRAIVQYQNRQAYRATVEQFRVVHDAETTPPTSPRNDLPVSVEINLEDLSLKKLQQKCKDLGFGSQYTIGQKKLLVERLTDPDFSTKYVTVTGTVPERKRSSSNPSRRHKHKGSGESPAVSPRRLAASPRRENSRRLTDVREPVLSQIMTAIEDLKFNGLSVDHGL